ncbi:transposase [Streptococcus gallolyticus]|uniref:Transposase n=1 Tax=Streptococcus gallolyticus TaxID=315405 RepID=A0AA94M0Q5_9STRE|nr:transposase [Streptococcus gallolyticus]
MSHLQYTAKSHHLQWNMRQLSKICHQLYRDYCPDSLKQRHFYRICQLFPCGRLLERSRFNRRSRQLIWLMQLIRQAMNKEISPDSIVIIDSFPLALCHPVRNHIGQAVLKSRQILVTTRLNTHGFMVSKFTC